MFFASENYDQSTQNCVIDRLNYAVHTLMDLDMDSEIANANHSIESQNCNVCDGRV